MIMIPKNECLFLLLLIPLSAFTHTLKRVFNLLWATLFDTLFALRVSRTFNRLAFALTQSTMHELSAGVFKPIFLCACHRRFSTLDLQAMAVAYFTYLGTPRKKEDGNDEVDDTHSYPMVSVL